MGFGKLHLDRKLIPHFLSMLVFFLRLSKIPGVKGKEKILHCTVYAKEMQYNLNSLLSLMPECAHFCLQKERHKRIVRKGIRWCRPTLFHSANVKTSPASSADTQVSKKGLLFLLKGTLLKGNCSKFDQKHHLL